MHKLLSKGVSLRLDAHLSCTFAGLHGDNDRRLGEKEHARGIGNIALVPRFDAFFKCF